MRVIFLYYEGSWQETALQLIAAKLKAAMMVEGDLAQGLAAMDVDDGNLMDALMKAVSKGRTGKIEWSGMQIAAISTPVSNPQPTLLPEIPQHIETSIDIVQLEVGGGTVQLTWDGLDLATLPEPTQTLRPVKKAKQSNKLKISKVNVAKETIQYSFL